MNITGRIVLVSGARTGIGKRTSLLLWEAGHSVVLAGRRVEPLEQTVKEASVRNLILLSLLALPAFDSSNSFRRCD